MVMMFFIIIGAISYFLIANFTVNPVYCLGETIYRFTINVSRRLP